MNILNKQLLYISCYLFALFPAAASGQTKITNPLKADSVMAFINDLIEALMYLAIPVIVIFIIYAGFLFVTAGGDEQKIARAKKTALYTVIGAAIILGAQLLSDILVNTADNLGVDGLN